MKYLLPILLSFSVLCTSLTAVEYGHLTLNYTGNWHSNISSLSQLNEDNYVILETGDVLEFTYLHNVNDQYYFRFTFGTEYSENLWDNSHGMSFPSVGDEIPGPCIIFLDQNGGGNSSPPLFAYKITRASEEVLTSNTVTLPAVNGLGWAVTLEQSTDLANWTAVAPGTVTGTDSLQFYRVRVTSNASSGE